MVGMAIAVAILILVLSVMNGFEREFTDRILGFVPHASLNLSEPQKDSWSEVIEQLEGADGITDVSAFVQLDAMLIRGSEVKPLRLIGQSMKQIEQTYAKFLATTSKQPVADGIFLGHRLAKSVGVEEGDSIRLLFNNNINSEDEAKSLTLGSNRIATYKLAGTIDSGTELDGYIAVAPLQSVAALKYGSSSGHLIDGFQLRVDRIFDARSIVHAAAIENKLYGTLNDWSSQYGNLYLAIQLSRQMVVFLLAAIVAIAAFNIFVTLGMSVRHRQNEIAILRTLGFGKRSLRITFCLQGIFIFLPGFVWGACAGVILAFSIPQLVPLIELVFGIEFLDPSVYPIDYLPSEVRLFDIIFIFFMALLISIMATLVPAWRAANLQPAAVLK